MAGSGPWGGNPLGYSDQSWLAYKGIGGRNVNNNVTLGQQNDLGIDDPFDSITTLVTISSGEDNAAFAALNGGGNPPPPEDSAAGGVGVFGQSAAGGIDEHNPPAVRPPITTGIGVAGHCNTGCGVYGQSLYGAGVAGFASNTGWGSLASTQLVHATFQNAGVLGVNAVVLGEAADHISGAGVRGHGDSFQVVLDDAQIRPSNDLPGGVFSSGTLAYRFDSIAGKNSAVFSRSSQAQLRLVPFQPAPTGGRFPDKGVVGDFFMTFNSDGVVANLFLCVNLDNDPVRTPIWFQVAMTGPPHRGGDRIG